MRRDGRSYRHSTIVLSSVFVVGLLVLWAPCALAIQGNGKLQIHHISVGQGDGSVIISPLGQVAIVDNGPYNNCTPFVNYVTGLGITSVDYHFVSHYHADHIGCLDELLATGVTLNIAGYDRGYSYSTATYTTYVNTLGAKRQTMTKNQIVTLDAGSAHPVYIKCVDLNGAGVYSPTGSDENAKSMVLKISYGAFDESMGGDLTASPSVEPTVGAEMGDVEVYKVHHHSSGTSSYDQWLNYTTPEVGIISLGTNSYGYVNSATLSRLHNHGVHTYWTHAGSGASPDTSWDKVGSNIVIQANYCPGAAYTVSCNGFVYTYYNSGTADVTPPVVASVTPAGGEIVYVGSEEEITWVATDGSGVDSVSIYYSINGGSTFPYTIATGEANDSSYTWVVPNTPSENCVIKVVAYDQCGNSGYGVSATSFKIRPVDLTPPTVAVVAPNGSEIWYAGDEEEIAWVATDNVAVDSISIYYSTDGGSTFPYTIATGESNDSSYTWVIPNTPSESCIVKVVAYDSSVNSGQDVSDAAFSIRVRDLTPPEVVVVAPADGETLYVGEEAQIQWVATDNVAVDSISIYYSTDGGATFPYTIATGEPNDSSYTWVVPDTPSEDCLVKVVAYDSSANPGESVPETTFSIVSEQVGTEVVPVAARFELMQNVPNPFNPLTKIEFSLTHSSRVTVRIYDMSGGVVKTLADDARPAGRHSVVWRGEDERGAQVASGVYSYVLEAEGQKQMRKLVLLR